MRKALAVTATAVLAGSVLGGLAAPASAGTTTTFSITSGALSVTAPSSVALSDVAPGGNATGALGPVSVADARASLTGAWTASVVSSAFTTGGGTTAETIPATAVTYWSGLATSTSGLGVFVPGQLTALNAVAINAPQTAFSRALSVGNSTAAWSPTVTVAVPATAVVGTYTGTITHSIA
jgi:hypothetical protein